MNQELLISLLTYWQGEISFELEEGQIWLKRDGIRIWGGKTFADIEWLILKYFAMRYLKENAPKS